MVLLNRSCDLCNFSFMCTNNFSQSLDLFLSTSRSLLLVTSTTLSNLKFIPGLVQLMLWGIQLSLDIIQLSNVIFQIIIQSLNLLSKNSNFTLIFWQFSPILLHLTLNLLLINRILLNSWPCLITILWYTLDHFIQSLYLIWHCNHLVRVLWHVAFGLS